MSHFLYNLRNGNMRRYDKNRNYYHNNSNNNTSGNNGNINGNLKRPNAHSNHAQADHAQDGQLKAFNESISSIKLLMEELINTQKAMSELEKRRADAENRQAESLEKIAYVLGQQSTIKTEESPSVAAQEDEKADYTVNAHPPEMQHTSNVDLSEMSREEVLNKIGELREEQMSFGRIAQYFESNGIPTFSGKGKWYASTVANLWKNAKANMTCS